MKGVRQVTGEGQRSVCVCPRGSVAKEIKCEVPGRSARQFLHERPLSCP